MDYILGGILFLLSLLGILHLKSSSKKEVNVNSKPKNREAKVGEVDKSGWKQELQSEERIDKKDLPEGIEVDDVATSINIGVDIVAENNNKKPTRELIEDIKAKYGPITLAIVWLSVFCFPCFSQDVVMRREDYNLIMKSLEKLASIEEAEPVIELEEVQLLIDSVGRVYSKPSLRGTMEIASLTYKLSSDVKISAIHNKRKYSSGKLFSLSALYSDNEFGLAGSFQLFTIRPLIYVNLKTYGFGLRLKIYNNLGFLIGIDYPKSIPRFGFLFRI